MASPNGKLWRWLVGPIAGRLARERSGPEDGAFSISEVLKAPEHILIIPDARPGGIFLAAPHFWAIRNHYPDTQITMLVRSDREYIAREIPFIDHRVVYDEFMLPFGGRVSEAVKQLSGSTYDIAFCFSSEESICPAYLCKKSGARLRIGFQRNDATYYNIQIVIQVVPKDEITYETKRLALIPRILGIPEVEERISWSVSAEGTKKILKRFLVGRKDGERFVALDVSSSSGWRPSVRQFQSFARTVLAEEDVRLLLFFDYESRKEANQITDNVRETLGARVLPFQVDDLPKVVALLSACDLLVACNTDLFHLAVSVQLPVVGILPDEECWRWAPEDVEGVHAYKWSTVRDWGTDSFRKVLGKVLEAPPESEEPADPVTAGGG